MINFSKTILLSTLLFIFIIATGFFAYQWWQVKGELGKQIARNENLTTQVNELQAKIAKLKKEIEELKTSQIKEKVTIATDKPEYRQGEEVKISVDYDGNLYIWSPPSCWSIQKRINDSWVEFQKFSRNPCRRECRDVPLDKILPCAKCPLEPPAWYLKSGDSVTFVWGRKKFL